MTIRKVKFFMPNNIEKEEEWLTEMSRKGLHLKKYQYFSYVFEEDSSKSYIYQIDFRREPNKDYVQLYEDAGWEYVTNSMNAFHYFRTDASQSSIRKLYSDHESIQDSYKRIIGFYYLIFFLFLVAQIGVIVTWNGSLFHYILAGVDILVVVLYLYLFYSLNKRINYYRRR